MVKLVLGLGSNMGNRPGYLRKAVKKICLLPGFDYLALSRIYETEPWGFKNQDKFLNCILVCLCRQEPEAAIKMFRRIELVLGRKKRAKWRKREIDIDILFYGDRIVNKRGLKIPHPQLTCRNFILKPLAELAPGFIHPELKKRVEHIYKSSTDKNRVYLYSEKL